MPPLINHLKLGMMGCEFNPNPQEVETERLGVVIPVLHNYRRVFQTKTIFNEFIILTLNCYPENLFSEGGG